MKKDDSIETVRTPVEEKPAEKLTEKDIDDMFEGSITQSLIASIKVPPDFNCKEFLAEAIIERIPCSILRRCKTELIVP
jgi:hypothetical protein